MHEDIDKQMEEIRKRREQHFETEFPFSWNNDFYFNTMIENDLKINGVDATEENLNILRKGIDAFLKDCLRIGRYYLYNFIQQPKGHDSVYYHIYHKWSYEYYTRPHTISLSISSAYPYTCYLNKNPAPHYEDRKRYCSITQAQPYLPHPEVIKACGLTPDGGLKYWHEGGENKQLGVRYDIEQNVVFNADELLEFNDYILENGVPFLASYVQYRKLNSLNTNLTL